MRRTGHEYGLIGGASCHGNSKTLQSLIQQKIAFRSLMPFRLLVFSTSIKEETLKPQEY